MRENRNLCFNNIVPTAAMKRGHFSAPGLPVIYDPLTTRPPSELARSARLFRTTSFPRTAFQPGEVLQSIHCNPNTSSGMAAFAPSRSLDQDELTVRGDWKLAGNHKSFARWSWHDNRQQDPNAYPGVGRAPLKTHAPNPGASLTSRLRPNLIHDFSTTS